MARLVVIPALLLTLALPALARGEMWKWRDRSGQLHYSNVGQRVPKGAVQVRGSIGYVYGEPEAYTPEETPAPPASKPEARPQPQGEAPSRYVAAPPEPWVPFAVPGSVLLWGCGFRVNPGELWLPRAQCQLAAREGLFFQSET